MAENHKDLYALVGLTGIDFFPPGMAPCIAGVNNETEQKFLRFYICYNFWNLLDRAHCFFRR